MIVDKIDWDTESNNATIFKNIYTCFEPHFKQPKSTIENIDKLVGIDGIGSEQLAKDLEYERRLSSTKRTRGIHKSK